MELTIIAHGSLGSETALWTMLRTVDYTSESTNYLSACVCVCLFERQWEHVCVLVSIGALCSECVPPRFSVLLTFLMAHIEYSIWFLVRVTISSNLGTPSVRQKCTWVGMPVTHSPNKPIMCLECGRKTGMRVKTCVRMTWNSAQKNEQA